MSPQSRPTDAELKILNVLWERGPSTVREVQESLRRSTGYTTVLKLLQIMADERLLSDRNSAQPRNLACDLKEVSHLPYLSV